MLKVFDSESEIGSALRRFRFAIGQISIISAVLNILMLGGSFFMLLVYDEVLPSRSIPTLVGLLIIITIVYCFQGILDLLRSRAMIQIGALVDREITPRVFDVITKMELRRREMPEGTQAARDLDAIRSYVSGSGPLALLDLPWVFLYQAVLFMFHWTLGVLASIGVVVLVAIMLAADRMTKSATMKATQIGSSRSMLIEMCRRNAEVIYALGMHRRARQSWEDATAAFVRSTDRLADVGGRMQGLSKTFRMLLQSLMLAAGAALVIDNLASGGVIIAAAAKSAQVPFSPWLFAAMAGINLTHVPYRGTAATVNDVVGGHIEVMLMSPITATGFVKSGRLRALGISGPVRSPWLPDVPTMQEQGAKGGFYDTRAFAVFAVPAATPKDVVKKLSDTLFEAGTDEKVKALMANYLIVGPLNFEATNKVFKRDTEIMLKVMKEIGIKAE